MPEGESESGDECDEEVQSDGEEQLNEIATTEQVVISTNDEAMYVFGKMTIQRKRDFAISLLTSDKFDDELLRKHLADVLAAAATRPASPHHPTPAAIARTAAKRATVAAANDAVPPDDAEGMRQEALADAKAKIVAALDLIAAAERALGGTNQLLRAACEALQDTTGHLAAGAVRRSFFLLPAR